MFQNVGAGAGVGTLGDVVDVADNIGVGCVCDIGVGCVCADSDVTFISFILLYPLIIC